MAEPKTITAVAIALIEPKCFVPKYSAQKAPGIVELAPWVIPKSRNANPAIIIESPTPKRKNEKAMEKPT